jgi:hypothetical protein
MPIIQCTGYSEMVSAEKAKEVGTREFVMKSIVKKQPAETIRRVLDGTKVEARLSTSMLTFSASVYPCLRK